MAVFLAITRLCTDGYSTVNLVTDNLQRTCTGTIIVELSGSGYDETDTQDNSSSGSNTGSSTESGSSSGSGSSSEGGTNENTSTEETQVTTESMNSNNNNGGGESYDGDIDKQTTTGDNVHLGPAGIGLLVMGFLILGCKCSNTSFGVGLSKKMGKEIGFSFFDKI